MKYRKKPVVIDAMQFDGTNISEIWETFGAEGIYGPTEVNPDHLILTTMDGDPAPCRPGEWIIPDGIPGAFHPCKPDIFVATYEPMEDVPEQVARLLFEQLGSGGDWETLPNWRREAFHSATHALADAGHLRIGSELEVEVKLNQLEQRFAAERRRVLNVFHELGDCLMRTSNFPREWTQPQPEDR